MFIKIIFQLSISYDFYLSYKLSKDCMPFDKECYYDFDRDLDRDLLPFYYFNLFFNFLFSLFFRFLDVMYYAF